MGMTIETAVAPSPTAIAHPLYRVVANIPRGGHVRYARLHVAWPLPCFQYLGERVSSRKSLPFKM